KNKHLIIFKEIKMKKSSQLKNISYDDKVRFFLCITSLLLIALSLESNTTSRIIDKMIIAIINLT
ncbi:hypothetical protein J8A97_23995, partial [Vibrio parahaemolyticus]|nr:hypothetical protein [Vibrio parahaemolyticus]